MNCSKVDLNGRSVLSDSWKPADHQSVSDNFFICSKCIASEAKAPTLNRHLRYQLFSSNFAGA